MTAHARRFGRQCREHFEHPETARAAEPEPDSGTVPAPEHLATAEPATEEQVPSGK